jgi:hypothetical protein
MAVARKRLERKGEIRKENLPLYDTEIREKYGSNPSFS